MHRIRPEHRAERRAATGRSRAVGAASLALLTAVLTGCALLFPPSPTTTVTDASGAEVTLDWADYPADPETEPADVLAAPRADAVVAVGDEVLDGLQAALDEYEPGADWTSDGTGEVYDSGENGYGGPSLHRVLNSAQRSTDDVPSDWPALAEALDEALATHGYGPVEWDFEREPYAHETSADRDADVRSTNGSLDPAQMWQWMGIARNGSMWVSVSLWDIDRGVGAPPDMQRDDPRSFSFMVGGTVIAAADEQAYRDGIAPFAGLERPELTES